MSNRELNDKSIIVNIKINDKNNQPQELSVKCSKIALTFVEGEETAESFEAFVRDNDEWVKLQNFLVDKGVAINE